MTGRSPADRPVVVGVDGSASALAAGRWAAAEAVRRGTRLRLVTALTYAPNRVVEPTRLSGQVRDVLTEHARSGLVDAAAAARQVAPDLEVSAGTRTGFPVDVLAGQAHEAGLLVLGNRGRGGLAGLLVGSVTVALAARASCPVVVVREDHPAAGPVVLGVDGEHGSDAAIAFAHESAAARGVPLIAVHTWTGTEFAPAGPPVLDWDAVLEQERAVLAERLAPWSEKYPDLRVHRTVGRHGAAAALVRLSEQAQLVVVGSHGHGNLAGLLLGSVSHSVLHRSHCPVAIVRPEAGGSAGAP
ncbi:universal stress protein [Pseudonocardia humida]|uniref:Universal stress protein n=1 Tax=Pseudonocardia humida TaxID=2800819 RepID=A0ABT1AAA4_9PSEU|nr:universal stress protein [Pseudonocardia humida]MCO1659938.1 universal stress protein [Pseudonocardia humida]